MKIKILGCGSAYGVPFAGGGWGACDPGNPRNRRLTPSILIEDGNSRLLVDMGPDFRQQAEAHEIRLLDGVILTHPHADHITGMFHLPVLMSWYQDRNLPLFATRATIRETEKNWWYMFDPKINVEYSGPGRPYWREVVPYEEIPIGAFMVTPFLQHHGKMDSLGIRIGNFAYSTDVRGFPERSLPYLKNLDVWVVECNNEFDQDGSHSYLAQTLNWIEQHKPEKAYLTHLDYTMDFDAISAKLPANVELAYDGLEIVV